MTFAIHSADGHGMGAGMADYPPPFKHAVPSYVKAIRNALWAIEGGLWGQVEWHATFGVRQNEIALMCASVHGSQFGAKKRRVA